MPNPLFLQDDDEDYIPGDMVGGQYWKKLKVPVYKNNANDLKHLRDKIKFGKNFFNHLKNSNQGVLIQVPQAEAAWYEVIKVVAETGTCGLFEKGSYQWVFYIWKLFLQTIGNLAYSTWEKYKNENPELRMELLNREGEPGDYVFIFVGWFNEQVRSTSHEVKEQLKKTLFPELSDAIMGEDAAMDEEELDLDNMSWEASDDEEEQDHKDQGAKEAKEVKHQEHDVVAKDALEAISTDELIAAFRKVDLDAVSREEKEEEAKLSKLKSDAMDTGA